MFSYDRNVTSAYISHWTRRAYPLGLIPGLRVRLSNMIKVISKKGHGYLISTVFTNMQLLNDKSISAETDIDDKLLESNPPEKRLINPLIGYSFVSLNETQHKFEAFECLLTLEAINKISITAMCKSCGSSFSNGGSCSFVGCHIPADKRIVNFKCSAIFQMEDETYGANIYVKDLIICRNMFYMLSDNEWEWILKTAEQKGEVVYLNDKKKPVMEKRLDHRDIYSSTQACFNIFCEVYPLTSYSQFLCKLRPFYNVQQTHSINWSNDHLNFICLDAKLNC